MTEALEYEQILYLSDISIFAKIYHKVHLLIENPVKHLPGF